MSRTGGALAERLAAAALQLGAVAVVLAVVPFKQFDLDRFFIPKELVLHVAATLAALVLLARAKRLELTRIDTLLVAYLGLSLVSALFAPNWWLAGRALAVSLSGVAVFWAARAVARAGLSGVLLGAVGVAVVVAAVTALLQAYGVESEYVSINRAPGGTLGNRNFVAHLAAIGTPLLFLRTLTARSRVGAWLGAAGLALVAAALVLSRSRAAWLALIVCGVMLIAAMLGRWRMWRDAVPGGRVRLVAASVAIAVLAAVFLPNTLNWRSDSPYLDSVRGVVNYHEGSGRGRLIQYRNTVRMALAHPVLGVGPGNWPVRYPRYSASNDPSIDQDDGMTSNPWPSSDWAAMLSERGLLAFACLLLATLGLAVGALVALARARNAEELVPPVALLGALAATGVVGAFDAVLLLPAPALLVWLLLGALAPNAAPRAELALAGGARWWGMVGVLVVGALASLHSAAQVAAMSAYESNGRITTIERAARLDPGSYRIQMRLAEVYAHRGRCDRVARYAGRARALFPSAPAPRRLLAACGVRERRR